MAFTVKMNSVANLSDKEMLDLYGSKTYSQIARQYDLARPSVYSYLSAWVTKKAQREGRSRADVKHELNRKRVQNGLIPSASNRLYGTHEFKHRRSRGRSRKVRRACIPKRPPPAPTPSRASSEDDWDAFPEVWDLEMEIDDDDDDDGDEYERSHNSDLSERLDAMFADGEGAPTADADDREKYEGDHEWERLQSNDLSARLQAMFDDEEDAPQQIQTTR